MHFQHFGSYAMLVVLLQEQWKRDHTYRGRIILFPSTAQSNK
jgi:hypothetical protein